MSYSNLTIISRGNLIQLNDTGLVLNYTSALKINLYEHMTV